MAQHKALIIGCGYSGERLAARLLKGGVAVSAVLRSDDRARRLDAMGVRVLQHDLDAQLSPTEQLAPDTVVYYLAPPPRDGDTDTRLDQWLAAQHGTPARLVYTSTSGVYGDCGGRPVPESTPLNPGTARAVRRVAAERSVEAWAANNGTDWLVLRVAGIYGPGRLPIDSVARGEPVIREADAGPGNRIHVDDLVTAMLQAGTADFKNAAVNVADGNSYSGTWFRQKIAGFAGLPAPPEVSRETARETFSPMRYSFLAESRQLDVTRLLQELKVELKWADQSAGIEDSVRRTPRERS